MLLRIMSPGNCSFKLMSHGGWAGEQHGGGREGKGVLLRMKTTGKCSFRPTTAVWDSAFACHDKLVNRSGQWTRL